MRARRRFLVSGAAFDHVRGRIDANFVDLGEKDAEEHRAAGAGLCAQTRLEAAAPAPFAPNKQEPPRLSIVVLPFANMSGDPEQDYFVDGVTESLTTDLSRIDGSFVIGRNTAFTYKGKHVDLRADRPRVERSLCPRGQRSARRQSDTRQRPAHRRRERQASLGGTVRKPLADLFDMQDEIVARLANALSAQLIAAEARRAERAPKPDSMDLCFQGRAWLNKGITPDNLAEARRLFERALALDPTNIWALVGIANVDTVVALSFLPDDRAARLAAAEAALTKALSLAPENAVAHLCLGIVQIHTNRASQGIRECERALELDRNLANAHGQIGVAKILLGQAEETEAHIQEALRLSPRDTYA